MAQVVSEMPGRGAKGGSQYDKYFDGKIWEITKEDFEGSKTLESIRGGMKTTADRRRLRLETRIVADKLYVQAHPERNTAPTTSILDTQEETVGDSDPS
jgi:hypothetical protein